MEFRPFRRKRQLLSEEERQQILSNASSGVLCLIGDGGYPYGVPMSYVYSNGKLYFHSAPTGHKIDAVTNNEKASFTVIAKDELHPQEFTTYFRSVIAFGRTRLIDNNEEKMTAIRELCNRYHSHNEEGFQKEVEKDFHRMAMIEMTIEHLTGKEAIELARARQ